MTESTRAQQRKIKQQLIRASHSAAREDLAYSCYEKLMDDGVSEEFLYKSLKGSPMFILRVLESASPIRDNRKKDFILAIFRQFLFDLVSVSKPTRDAAIGFYKSANMDWYLNVLGVDEEWFRGLLKSSFVVLAEEK